MSEFGFNPWQKRPEEVVSSTAEEQQIHAEYRDCFESLYAQIIAKKEGVYPIEIQVEKNGLVNPLAEQNSVRLYPLIPDSFLSQYERMIDGVSYIPVDALYQLAKNYSDALPDYTVMCSEETREGKRVVTILFSTLKQEG